MKIINFNRNLLLEQGIFVIKKKLNGSTSAKTTIHRRKTKAVSIGKSSKDSSSVFFDSITRYSENKSSGEKLLIWIVLNCWNVDLNDWVKMRR